MIEYQCVLVKEYVVHKVLGEDYTGPIYLDDAVWAVVDFQPHNNPMLDNEWLADGIAEELAAMKIGESKIVYGIPVDCVEVYEEYCDAISNHLCDDMYSIEEDEE